MPELYDKIGVGYEIYRRPYVSRGQVLNYHFLRYGMGRSARQRWQ